MKYGDLLVARSIARTEVSAWHRTTCDGGLVCNQYMTCMSVTFPFALRLPIALELVKQHTKLMGHVLWVVFELMPQGTPERPKRGLPKHRLFFVDHLDGQR